MKRRNKKYKPRAMKLRLFSWESDRSGSNRFVTAQARHPFGWIDLSGEASFSAINKKRNWTLVIRVIEWHASGDVDIYPAVANFRNVTLKTLEEEAKLMRKKAIQKCDEKRIVDVGWLAITFDDKPCVFDDTAELGSITEARQMLWNNAWREEVKAIVEQAA